MNKKLKTVLSLAGFALFIGLAVFAYNRLGQEGETNRKEGEITVRMEMMPEDIKVMLRPWRLAKAVTLCG